MKTTPCKGCGKPIVWARDVISGSMVPLDPRPPVYLAMDQSGVMVCERGVQTESMKPMVSHFATCPKANEFSGKNREGKP